MSPFRSKPHPRPWPVLLTGVMALTACLNGSPTSSEDIQWEVIEEVEFDPSLDIDLSQMTKTPSGLYYQDLVVGEGDLALPGQYARVTATGWLRTAQVFQPEATFEFLMGAGRVINGFEEGVKDMHIGGKRKLVVPPELGYGSGGNPAAGIPPGAVLVFQVELLSTHF